jgi:hypothetical protein
MFKARKIFTATLAGLAIASASPASAQWGWGYGGYGGYGYGGCGWGGCYNNNTGAVVGAAVAGMAVGAIAAGVAAQSRNNAYYAPQPQYVAPRQRQARSRKGGTCYQQQWDSAEGWVNVAVPCR